MEVAGTALAVASAAATTTLVITKLVLEVRELRDELEATQAELRSIDGVLFSIADVVHSSTHAGSAISASLLQRLADVIKRCEDAVVDTSSLVRRFSGGGFRRTAKWFLAGKNEVATMQGRLARCKEDLILALSMLNISVSSSVHDGTAELLQGNDSIRRDVQQIIAGVRSLQDDQVKMDELLVLLRSLSMQSTHNIMLDRFVSNLSDYAQTVYERSTVVADGDVEAYASLPAQSPLPEASRALPSPAAVHCNLSSEDWDSIFGGLEVDREIVQPLSTVTTTAHFASPGQPSTNRTAAESRIRIRRPTRDANFMNQPHVLGNSAPYHVLAVQAAGNDTSSLSETSSAGQMATTKAVGLVDTAQPRDSPWEQQSVQTGRMRGCSHRADAESLLDALLEVDLEKVRKLLDAGVNPRRAIIQIAGSRPGCTQVEPLRRLLNKAVREDCMHEVYPILELILVNTSHDLVELHGELQRSLLSPLLVSFIQNVGARPLKDKRTFLWSKTDWQLGNSRGGFRDVPFDRQYYNTHVYRMAPIFANLLIVHGADPDYQAPDSPRDRPLRLALVSLNPAMASMLVLRLRGPAGDRKPRAPFLRHDSVDNRFTIMILRNIRDQHRCMDTSPWLRYIIESDARIGARLLCKTIMFLSHKSFLGFEASDIVAAVFALVSFDADPLLRVKISYTPDRPPFSATSIRYGNVIILGARSINTVVTQNVNALELIDRIAIYNDVSPTTRSIIKWRMRSAKMIPVAQRLRRE